MGRFDAQIQSLEKARVGAYAGLSQQVQSLADTQRRLEAETRCEVLFDRGSRLLYATDASLYQVEPVGARA